MASMTSLPMHMNSRFMTGSSGPPSEAQSSEISSVESDFSDLKSIAAGLGINDPDEVYTERFKIDRLKLEEMIKSKEGLQVRRRFFIKQFISAEAYCEGMNRAEYFFTTVSVYFSDGVQNLQSDRFSVDERKSGARFVALPFENWSENAQR